MKERARYPMDLTTKWHNRAIDRTSGNMFKLNDEQWCLYRSIINSTLYGHQGPRLKYLNAQAGTGKTFLANYVAGTLRFHEKIVLSCAPSARAAQSFMGGMTFHKCYECPIAHAFDRVVSLLTGTKHHSVVIQNAVLLIIDELPMLPANLLDALDQLLRDLMDCDEPFGGKHILACGDFRQLPCIVPMGGRDAVISCSVITHPTWPLWDRLMLFTLGTQAKWVMVPTKATCSCRMNFRRTSRSNQMLKLQ